MNYWRRYVGDYQRKTMRLDPTDHGVYDLMLDYYYAEEAPLPLELDDIYAICKAIKPEHRKSVAKVLRLYFDCQHDGYHNKRADEEIAVSKQARTNGKGGGRPPKKATEEETGTITGEETENETGSITETETETTTQKLTGSVHPPTTNHQPPSSNPQPPPTNLQPGRSKASARKRAAPTKTPLPDGFCVSDRVRQWAEGKGFSRIDEHAESFIGKARAKGYTYADWDEALMSAIRDDWAGLRKANGGWQSNADACAEAERLIFGNKEKDVTDESKRI